MFVTIREGEAKLMVKNVLNNDGLLACHRLFRHYNWRTLARVLRMTREALHPKAVHDLKQLPSKVVEWEDEKAVMAVEHVDRTRESAIEFNIAEVRKPLASAVRMVMAGNRVVLDSDDSYIENRKTGERMKLKVKDGTYVFGVQYKDGVNVWPQGRREDIPMMPKRSGSRMCAANGTEIQNLGRKIVQFRGVKAEAGHSSSSVFTLRV